MRNTNIYVFIYITSKVVAIWKIDMTGSHSPPLNMEGPILVRLPQTDRALTEIMFTISMKKITVDLTMDYLI